MNALEFLREVPITLFDPIFLVFFLIFVFEESLSGVLHAFFNFIRLTSSFFLGLVFYPTISYTLRDTLYFSKGLSDGIAFLLGWVIVWAITGLLLRRYIKKTKKMGRLIDLPGGLIFALPSFLFLSFFLTGVVVSLPSSQEFKYQATKSVFGKRILLSLAEVEGKIRLLGGEKDDILNFFTLPVSSEEVVSLHFFSKTPRTNQEEEVNILERVNEERSKLGVDILLDDTLLASIARAHAEDMAKRGSIGYILPEGYTIFDRFDIAGVVYAFGAVQIALAPDSELVLQQFLKNQSIRDSILDRKFKRAGVGVLNTERDGSIFVIMLVY